MIPVFVGPSLPPKARPAGPFRWCDPAAAGDLWSLVDEAPERLCLIDGFFDSRPAPWHKELLGLMARGTLVFGAASMGALRAAELEGFGMIGVGAIFRAYRDGRLTGDDEVALIHADERLDWAPLTVPMVEIRATLAAACRARVIAPPLGRRLRELIHDIHFTDRDWPQIERICVSAKLIDAPGCRRLRAMHVHLKQADALACLDAAIAPAAPRAKPAAPPLTCFMRDLQSRG